MEKPLRFSDAAQRLRVSYQQLYVKIISGQCPGTEKSGGTGKLALNFLIDGSVVY
jgi:hypothetical protein